MNIHAIIVAAGSGERMAGDVPKQLMPLAGMPMLAWSLKRIADRRNITEITLVTTDGMQKHIEAALVDCGVGDVDHWVVGGETRQASVRNGLAALPDEATHVLIHDAARPCLSDDLVQRVLDGLRDHDAVVPSIPAVDTLIEEHDAAVVSIVDRSRIGAVQTPQAFSVPLIREAHERAVENGTQANDDGTLVLELGRPVATVVGERSNLKVTFAEDVWVAETFLKHSRDI